ncbi:uncharacterized protein ATC70_001360 [Mucor velutinosus]|uniref:Uncharacterized protein n=1 Tax=Mucor velutinosus TaxID=708070 RepID=A0AAN7DNK9_9FUNG|nr:hypothetical protein ATC70_001360 [Mucor velutinosus]
MAEIVPSVQHYQLLYYASYSFDSCCFIGFSSEVLCTSLHNRWVFPEGAGNVKEIKSSVRVPHGSDPEHAYWMANGFNQGLF